MATTAKGTPYVVSTDLVANYPTVSSDLATHIDAKLAYNAVTINAQTGTTYTFALADASEGKLVTASNAAASTYTVPPQSSVTWAAGAVLRILNQGAGVVTIAAGSGVTINGTPLTLAQYKGAALQRTASDTWTFVPFSGGVGNAVISNTPTGSYTGYQYWTFTSSGTLTVTTAGFADVLMIAGGGGGAGGNAQSGGGGGAGGYLEITNMYLPSGSHTVTIGGGGTTGAGAAGGQGGQSTLLSYYAIGGGRGMTGGETGGFGGSGGANNGTGISGQGNAAGSPFYVPNYNAGGGGGSGGAGGSATTNNGGAGGTGSSNSYTGASVGRGGGGGGGAISGRTAGTATNGGGAGGSGAGSGTAGTANTGGGGGGGGGNNGTSGGAGGSGIIVVRVAV